MIKLIAVASISFCLVLAGFRFRLFWEPPAYSRVIQSPAELARQAQLLDNQLRARNYFVTIQDDILARLAQGEFSLPCACDQVYQCAREFYPKYLRFPGAVDKTPLKEKLARNIVVHFQFEAEDTPSFREVALRLQQEMATKPFRDWCQRPWAEE
jgi:hypothetical protein